MRRTVSQTRKRKGFVAFDTFVGLGLLAFMLLAFATLLNQQRTVGLSMSAQRTAYRTLEAAALGLDTENQLPEHVRYEAVDDRWGLLVYEREDTRAELFVPRREGGGP